MKDRFYVTTPIYYVNDVPHIGHTYTTVVADVVARYRRMIGEKVYFLTGTDEHGQKIERAALKQGIAPLELADRVVARYHDLWKLLDITNDDFIRTSEPRHHRGVEKIFRRIQDAGDIYLDSYEGMYCTGCESFYPESQIVDGRCPEQGHPVEKVREESYFFRLSRYQQPLLELYEKHPEFVRPDFRLNEVRRFVEMGLKDLSISRTAFKWGIPVPGNDRHVIYVWFDALSNYVTALGYAGGSPLYDACWPADLHLVGKDILRFHAVYWPAFLMSAGLPLPRTVFAHGWWLRSDAKMSKSTGNIVDPLPLIADFGADGLRYFLLREMGAKGGLLDAKDDLSAGPVALIADPELSKNNPDNPLTTAGITFLGQFLDHDITFDAASRLGVATRPEQSPNSRTPSFDLDSVYGLGPFADRHLYDEGDRVKFKVEKTSEATTRGRRPSWEGAARRT